MLKFHATNGSKVVIAFLGGTVAIESVADGVAIRIVKPAPFPCHIVRQLRADQAPQGEIPSPRRRQDGS